MILAFYFRTLNLDKVSTLKSNIPKSQFDKDIYYTYILYYYKIFNILFLKFNPSCQYIIHQFLLDQLLGENFNDRKYFLLALLVIFIPNSDLKNYLSILSTYNVPVISLTNTKLNTGSYFYNNVLSYKTRKNAAVNFLILFMTKANIKSLIILYDSTQRSKEIMLNFQDKLIEKDLAICQLYAYSIST